MRIRTASAPMAIALVATGVLAFGVACTTRAQPTPESGARDSTMERVIRERQLKVAYIHYPPTAFKDTNGRVTGVFVDLLEETVRQVDPAITISYEETNWADFTTALNSGRVDLSIAGTFATIPRAKLVAFTRPIAFLGRSAIVRKGDQRFDPAKGPEQFDRADLRIGVVSGEGSHEFVKANFRQVKNIVVFSGSDLSQALAAVSAGQVDVGMSDALETQKYATAHHDVTDLYGSQPYDLTPMAWAVRQGDDRWLQFLNTAIELFEVSGRTAKWEAKYGFRWTHPVIDFRVR